MIGPSLVSLLALEGHELLLSCVISSLRIRGRDNNLLISATLVSLLIASRSGLKDQSVMSLWFSQLSYKLSSERVRLIPENCSTAIPAKPTWIGFKRLANTFTDISMRLAVLPNT